MCILIGQKPMGYWYCASKLRELLLLTNCFVKAIDQIFYGFTGVITLLGMLGEHLKSLLMTHMPLGFS